MSTSSTHQSQLPLITVRPATAARILGQHPNSIYLAIADGSFQGCLSPSSRVTLIPMASIHASRGTKPAIDPTPYLTVSYSFRPKQVAEMMDVSVCTVFRWINQGLFPQEMVGHKGKRITWILGNGIAFFLKETRTTIQKKRSMEITEGTTEDVGQDR